MKARGLTTCLICDESVEFSVINDIKILFGVSLVFDTDNFNVMLQATKICINCAGRLQQLFDFDLIKRNFDQQRAEIGRDEQSCDFCVDGDPMNKHFNEKVKDAIAKSQFAESNPSGNSCFSCYNFLLLYAKTKEILETQRQLFYSRIKNCKVVITQENVEILESQLTLEETKSTAKNKSKISQIKQKLLNPVKINLKRGRPRKKSDEKFILKRLQLDECNLNLDGIDKFTAIKYRRANLPARSSDSSLESQIKVEPAEDVPVLKIETVQDLNDNEVEVVSRKRSLRSSSVGIAADVASPITGAKENEKNSRKRSRSASLQKPIDFQDEIDEIIIQKIKKPKKNKKNVKTEQEKEETERKSGGIKDEMKNIEVELENFEGKNGELEKVDQKIEEQSEETNKNVVEFEEKDEEFAKEVNKTEENVKKIKKIGKKVMKIGEKCKKLGKNVQKSEKFGKKSKKIEEKYKKIDENDEKIDENNEKIDENDEKIDENNEKIDENDEIIDQEDKKIDENDEKNQERNKDIELKHKKNDVYKKTDEIKEEIEEENQNVEDKKLELLERIQENIDFCRTQMSKKKVKKSKTARKVGNNFPKIKIGKKNKIKVDPDHEKLKDKMEKVSASVQNLKIKSSEQILPVTQESEDHLDMVEVTASETNKKKGKKSKRTKAQKEIFIPNPVDNDFKKDPDPITDPNPIKAKDEFVIPNTHLDQNSSVDLSSKIEQSSNLEESSKIEKRSNSSSSSKIEQSSNLEESSKIEKRSNSSSSSKTEQSSNLEESSKIEKRSNSFSSSKIEQSSNLEESAKFVNSSKLASSSKIDQRSNLSSKIEKTSKVNQSSNLVSSSKINQNSYSNILLHSSLLSKPNNKQIANLVSNSPKLDPVVVMTRIPEDSIDLRSASLDLENFDPEIFYSTTLLSQAEKIEHLEQVDHTEEVDSTEEVQNSAQSDTLIDEINKIVSEVQKSIENSSEFQKNSQANSENKQIFDESLSQIINYGAEIGSVSSSQLQIPPTFTSTPKLESFSQPLTSKDKFLVPKQSNSISINSPVNILKSTESYLKKLYNIRHCVVTLDKIPQDKLDKILAKRNLTPMNRVTKSGRIAKPTFVFDPSPNSKNTSRKKKQQNSLDRSRIENGFDSENEDSPEISKISKVRKTKSPKSTEKTKKLTKNTNSRKNAMNFLQTGFHAAKNRLKNLEKQRNATKNPEKVKKPGKNQMKNPPSQEQNKAAMDAPKNELVELEYPDDLPDAIEFVEDFVDYSPVVEENTSKPAVNSQSTIVMEFLSAEKQDVGEKVFENLEGVKILGD